MTRLLPFALASAVLGAASVLALALFAAGCTDSTGPAREAPLPEASLYVLDDAWQSDAGDTLALAALRGAPVAVAMIYVGCGTACPMIVRDLQRLRAAEGGAALRPVLVTLDPVRDDPAALRHFRAMHGLGPEWKLLRGSEASVQTLAALLGVRYRPEADGSIAHSNRITLLDADGRIVARQDGLDNDPAPTLARFRRTLER